MYSARAPVDGGAAHWSLRLLGGFELVSVRGGDRVALPGKRERVLLAYLALAPNGRAARRKLAFLLWEDAAEDAALHSLRNCLSVLRKALGDSEHRILSSDGEDIALNLFAVETDVLTFRRLLAKPNRAELEAAAKLCAGELLDGLSVESEELESWRSAEAARHREQSVDVFVRLMVQLEESEETERAIEAGVRVLALEPLHEAAARRLMRLYAYSGRRGTAIAVYRALAAGLRTELGAEPEPETRAVFAELSNGRQASAAVRHFAGFERKATLAATISADLAATVVHIPAQPEAYCRAAAGARGNRATLLRVVCLGIAAAMVLITAYSFLAPTEIAQLPAAKSSTAALSLAVLPFANLSGDPSQEFLSDGMTTEINAALAKVPGLTVIARMSAFQFKGEKQDVRHVGHALGASHLIKGSVRRAGEQVQVTAELIRAADGVQVWSQSYERNFSGVFAVQEEMATAVASALRLPLGLKTGEALVNNRSIDPVSYDLFLRAKALVDVRGLTNLTDAQRMLEEVVERNPDYAPAWAWLCAAYYLYTTDMVDGDRLSEDQRTMVSELLRKAENTCRRAIALDPKYPLAYATMATLAWSTKRPLEGEELYRKGLALDPQDANVLTGYGLRAGVAGRLKDGLDMLAKAHVVEPFSPVSARFADRFLWMNGKIEEAIAHAKALRPVDRAANLAMIYASIGRFAEAADALAHSPTANSPEVSEAVQLLRNGPQSKLPIQNLTAYPQAIDFLYLDAGLLNPVLARVLDNLELRVAAGFIGGEIAFLWHPAYAPVRKTERFKSFLRQAGYVDYWRVTGWPELCQPTVGEDFTCE